MKQKQMYAEAEAELKHTVDLRAYVDNWPCVPKHPPYLFAYVDKEMVSLRETISYISETLSIIQANYKKWKNNKDVKNGRNKPKKAFIDYYSEVFTRIQEHKKDDQQARCQR